MAAIYTAAGQGAGAAASSEHASYAPTPRLHFDEAAMTQGWSPRRVLRLGCGAFCAALIGCSAQRPAAELEGGEAGSGAQPGHAGAGAAGVASHITAVAGRGAPVAGTGGSMLGAGRSGAGAATVRSHEDCRGPSLARCYPSGTNPSNGGCGSPGWCGQCSCPPQLMVPFGWGEPCQADADCMGQTVC